MLKGMFADVLDYLRKVSAIQEARTQPDGMLLKRFIAAKEERAFSILVQRHGPMVLSVCQRVLGDSHGAEDCFQATFLALSRRAASIRFTRSLGTWLYSTALRIALRAKAQAATRRERERQAAVMSQREQLDDATWQELRTVLDEEIAKLPEKYQAPIILCHFEGKSHNEAAKELGCPKTTLTTRLERAHELLRQNLVKRGVGLSAAVLTTALCQKATATPVGVMLTLNTVRAATSVAWSKAVAAGWISARSVLLAEKAVAGMGIGKAMVVAMALALGVTVGGFAVVGYGDRITDDQTVSTPALVSPPIISRPAQQEPAVALDIYGDPLPEGAVARLGTERLRHKANALAFSPDGKVLASAGSQGYSICVWDPATGRALYRLPGAPSCHGVSFTPDSKSFLSVFQHATLFDAASGKEIRRLEKPPSTAGGFPAFSPDGRAVAQVLLVEKSWRIVLWDVSQEKDYRFVGDTENSSQTLVAFSPDGKLLASSSDKSIRLFDVKTGMELRRFDGTQDAIWALEYAPNGKMLASAGQDRRIRIWDVETGKQLFELKVETEWVVPALAFSPDSKVLATGGQAVRLWDTQTGNKLNQLNARSEALAFSPDGKTLAMVNGSAIRLWDAATYKEIHADRGHTWGVTSLWLAPDGITLLSSDGRSLLEWNLAKYETRHGFPDGTLGPAKEGGSWFPLDFAPDGKTVALSWAPDVGVKDPHTRMLICDAVTGKELVPVGKEDELPIHYAGRFSANGQFFATAGKAGVRVWQTATGKELLKVPERILEARLEFSPDSKLLIVGGNREFTVWDVNSGKEVRSWPSQFKRSIKGLAISADGQWIAACDEGTLISLWDMATGKKRLDLDVQTSDPQVQISSLRFSPNGRFLIASAAGFHPSLSKWSAPVYLWEIATGQQVKRFEVPQGNVYSLCFTDNGRTLATGGSDTTILLWDLTGRSKNGKLTPLSLGANDIAALWTDLAADAAKADSAIWKMASAPKDSVAWLKEKLFVARAAPDQVAKLIAELDSENFAARQKVQQSLSDMSAAAERAVRKALEGQITLEVRQRLQQILEKCDKDAIRTLRAVEVLEQAGTAESRQVLQALSEQSANPRVAAAARAAIQRVVEQRK
jgi:RNA polymerase sigma factor (sigma-70 family)